MTQALNGDSDGPVCRSRTWICFLDELFRREDDAAEAAALAVDMFGRRIDHAIGAERERRLKKRRREHVVDYERRACFMRDIGNRRDVDDLERRIGRRLQKEGLGIRPHRVAPLVEIDAVDQRRGNPEPRQIIFDDVAARAEQRLCARPRDRRF